MKEDIIRMAQEAGFTTAQDVWPQEFERFAALVADAEAKRMHAEGMVTVGHMRQQIAAERNKVASWMMAQGYATGHGDTTENLLQELGTEIEAKIAAEREAIIQMMPGGSGVDPQWFCDAIRARGQT